MVHYHIVDVESAGLRKPHDASGVVSVAYLKIDANTLEVTDEFYSLVNPGCKIESGAQAVHGLSDKDVAGKPLLHEVFKIEDPTVAIGHNQSFDAKFLDEHYTNKVGAYCTLSGARAYYKQAPNHKLQTLADYLDLKRGEAHNALGDCYTTLSLLRRIVQDSGRDLVQLVKAAAKPKQVHVMPFGAYKGIAIGKLPTHYIKWFDGKEIDTDLRYSFDTELKVRSL
jgi:exodeoxyribonuclease X